MLSLSWNNMSFQNLFFSFQLNELRYITIFIFIITKSNSVWLEQTEDLACREHVGGAVTQEDILSSRNVLT